MLLGGCFVGSPEVLDVRFAPPALGIKFAAITADSQVGFLTWISSERKGFTKTPFFSVKKGTFWKKNTWVFSKTPTCLRKKTRLFVDFPPMELMSD